MPRLLGCGELLWLDLCRPGGDDFALLTELSGIHPLAAEDVRQFGQRPRLDDYDPVTGPSSQIGGQALTVDAGRPLERLNEGK